MRCKPPFRSRSHQMKKTTYISLAVALFLFASAERASACSCIASREPVKKQVQQAFSGSTAIFSGEAIEVVQSPTDKNMLLVRFKVANAWKGGMKTEIT